MDNTRIRVGPEAFNVGEEYIWLSQCDEDGAVVTFTGKVRNHNLGLIFTRVYVQFTNA